jgi:hypothetical protein
MIPAARYDWPNPIRKLKCNTIKGNHHLLRGVRYRAIWINAARSGKGVTRGAISVGQALIRFLGDLRAFRLQCAVFLWATE